jgi:hypothetical protein
MQVQGGNHPPPTHFGSDLQLTFLPAARVTTLNLEEKLPKKRLTPTLA